MLAAPLTSSRLDDDIDVVPMPSTPLLSILALSETDVALVGVVENVRIPGDDVVPILAAARALMLAML